MMADLSLPGIEMGLGDLLYLAHLSLTQMWAPKAFEITDQGVNIWMQSSQFKQVKKTGALFGIIPKPPRLSPPDRVI